MKARIAGLVCAAAIAWGAIAPGGAGAQLSPGPMSRPHADLEGVQNCTHCHSSGRAVDPQKCLACHSALGERVAAGRGLHARPDHGKCETCHVEHHGRDYELLWWGKEGRAAFAHALTGFVLEGRHTALDCDRCHRPDLLSDAAGLAAGRADPKRTYLGLRRECGGCHRDVHEGRLGAQCQDCHDAAGWRARPGFDHEHTRYPLTGQHKTVACEKCHPPLTGADLAAALAREGLAASESAAPAAAAASNAEPRHLRLSGLRFQACGDCHEDPHRGQLGPECARCHTTAGWREVAKGQFDHDRTRYPLRGRHVTVPCNGCHRPDRPARGALRFAACTDCHADQHGGQFAARSGGGACEQCHTVNGYSPSTYTVERHEATAYPLQGAHLAVPCNGCHGRASPEAAPSTIRFKFASSRCADCHKDPHGSEAVTFVQKGGCEICHVVGSWRDARYDHETTRFPLTGKHKSATCVACHKPLEPNAPAGALRLRGLSLACAGCHPDEHRGQFAKAAGADDATDCARCHHDTAIWRADGFVHDRDSAFKLAGAHAKATCDQCHPKVSEGGKTFVRYKPIAHGCEDCHKTGNLKPSGGAPAGESD